MTTMRRQTFLTGLAGAAATAVIPALRSRGTQAQAGVTVDLSATTGKTVQPSLYGYATGALLDDEFLLASNAAAQRSARRLAPPLLRLNTSSAGILQQVFAHGVAQPDWAPFSRWSQHRGSFLGDGGRLVFGIGPSAADTSLSPATWAQYARATALRFRAAGQEITHWEVGNECDPMGATIYSGYFNAIADALHAVNPSSLVGGPVASWWNGIDLPAFISHSGTRLGFIDFHSYPVYRTDSTRAAYEKAVAFSDVRRARAAMAGTAAAGLPIGLLEYNMNGGEQPNGRWGLPAQAAISGAVYIALLLTQAFASDSRFTMGGLWDLVADSNYGAIGNAQDKSSYHAIDEQGWYLRQTARLLPGQQVTATTTIPDMQVLATRNDRDFAVQLVNFSLSAERSVAVSVTGRAPDGPVAGWLLSAHYPTGRVSAAARLTRVLLPPQSIVMLSGKAR